jgi:hypothetical protein
VQEPGKDYLDPREVDDRAIEQLLVNEHRGMREFGLALLDAKKRDKACGLLRFWSNNDKWHLSSADIAAIWEATMICIQKNVEARRFRISGRKLTLTAYVRVIVFRQAISFLRKRGPDFGWDVDLDAYLDDRAWRYDNRHRTHEVDIVDLIRSRFHDLSQLEQHVAKRYLRLEVAANGKGFSTSDLITACNKNWPSELTKGQVLQAKKRALRKLRGGAA